MPTYRPVIQNTKENRLSVQAIKTGGKKAPSPFQREGRGGSLSRQADAIQNSTTPSHQHYVILNAVKDLSGKREYPNAQTPEHNY